MISEFVKICDNCGSSNCFVSNVRVKDDTGLIKRWRRCRDCGYKWTTIETKEERYDELINSEGCMAVKVLDKARELYLKERELNVGAV